MATRTTCPTCNAPLTVAPGLNICRCCGAEITIHPTELRRVHLYPWQDVLRPRGGELRKESLAAEVFERMARAYREWTDPEYGDLPEPAELRERIVRNAREETELAISEFVRRFGDRRLRTNQRG